MKSVLITGGCGFIGSNFINYFHSIHPDTVIINLDAMYYCADEQNIHTSVQESPNYFFIKGKYVHRI